LKPSGHVPNHAGDLSRATGHLRAAVAKRRGRPPAAPFLLHRGIETVGALNRELFVHAATSKETCTRKRDTHENGGLGLLAENNLGV